MKLNLKARVGKLLSSKLTAEQLQLFRLVSVENQKGIATFRMPTDVISLENVWCRVVEVMTEAKIAYKRVNPFATLEELDDILSGIEWLWPGWIPKGFSSLLVGDPGVGKSIIALNLVAKVISGDCFPLEADKHRPQNVIWIETEASQQVLNIRAKAFGFDRKKLFLPVIDGDLLGQPDISNESHREQIVQLIEAKEPALIVLDSLGSSQPGGENRKEDIAPVMEFFAMVARDYNTSVLVVHHLRKQSPNESTEVSLGRVRGSTAISALCRSVIAVTNPQEEIVRLSHIKANLARKQKPISVKFIYNKQEDVESIEYGLYQPPAPKRNKKELCADWVISQLSLAGSDGVGLRDLTDRGEANGYTRANLYSAKELLDERIAVSGTGNAAIWTLTNMNDEEAEKHITKAMKKGKV